MGGRTREDAAGLFALLINPRFFIVCLAAAVLFYLGALLVNYAQNSNQLVTLLWQPYLFRESIDSHSKDSVSVADRAMFPSEKECRKFLREEANDLHSWVAEGRAKYPKTPVPTIDLRCIPETDPTVSEEWRSPIRRLGKWHRFDVYYYHEPEALALGGAYVLALEGHTWKDKPELDEIFVDQRSCDAQLAGYKDQWHQDKASDEEEFRKALGACIPIASAKPLVENYCDGLPLRLEVVGGLGSYRCDSGIVMPSP
jgi:hypothetical protein